MSQHFEEYNFYFKLVYTEQTFCHTFSPNISIKNFIESVKYNSIIDFQLENNSNIEIIESGQYNNINGRDAELAPALIPSNNTLRQIYRNRFNYISFYIRIS